MTIPDSPSLIQVPLRRIRAYVQLRPEAMRTLFGPGAALTLLRDLPDRPHFAANEVLALAGPCGELRELRIVGPVAAFTEIVLAPSLAQSIGLAPPVRLPGDQDETEGGMLIGPAGRVELDDGILILQPHLRMAPDHARQWQLGARDRVTVCYGGLELTALPIAIVKGVTPAVWCDADTLAGVDWHPGLLAQVEPDAPSPLRLSGTMRP